MNSHKTIQEIARKRAELAFEINNVISQFSTENEDIEVIKVEYRMMSPHPAEVIFRVEDLIIKPVYREDKGKLDGFA